MKAEALKQDIKKGQDDLKQELQNVKNELQQGMGVFMTKFCEIDKCIGVMEQETFLVKTR